MNLNCSKFSVPKYRSCVSFGIFGSRSKLVYIGWQWHVCCSLRVPKPMKAVLNPLNIRNGVTSKFKNFSRTKTYPQVFGAKSHHLLTKLGRSYKGWLLNKIKSTWEKKTVFHCKEWELPHVFILFPSQFEIIAQTALGLDKTTFL